MHQFSYSIFVHFFTQIKGDNPAHLIFYKNKKQAKHLPNYFDSRDHLNCLCANVEWSTSNSKIFEENVGNIGPRF